MKQKNILIGILILAFAVDGFIWFEIFAQLPQNATIFSFLDVGQGDAELVEFRNGSRLLIDAGPGTKLAQELKSALGENKYIDLALVTHPELDHFGGLSDALDRYTLGAVIFSGRDRDALEWEGLKKKIETMNIPVVILKAGDKIRIGETVIDFYSPTSMLMQSAETNDTSLVFRLDSPDADVLYTGDIDSKLEARLIKSYDLAADILKVPHHGSKYSSSAEFLAAVNPALTVIEVGSRNSYGHPARETLERLEKFAQVFRTDRDGTVKIEAVAGKLRLFTSRK